MENKLNPATKKVKIDNSISIRKAMIFKIPSVPTIHELKTEFDGSDDLNIVEERHSPLNLNQNSTQVHALSANLSPRSLLSNSGTRSNPITEEQAERTTLSSRRRNRDTQSNNNLLVSVLVFNHGMDRHLNGMEALTRQLEQQVNGFRGLFQCVSSRNQQ